MKNKISALIFLLSIQLGFSQEAVEPVSWETTFEKISDNNYNLIFTAKIQNTWHLYSQNVPENGPLPTVFKLISHENYEVIGNVTEEKGKTVYEEVFEMKIKYFESKTVFKQRIKTKKKKDFKISGTIDYMTCNSIQCIPGSTIFEIEIKY